MVVMKNEVDTFWAFVGFMDKVVRCAAGFFLFEFALIEFLV